jgi:hypothetical protein
MGAGIAANPHYAASPRSGILANAVPQRCERIVQAYGTGVSMPTEPAFQNWRLLWLAPWLCPICRACPTRRSSDAIPEGLASPDQPAILGSGVLWFPTFDLGLGRLKGLMSG